eukprot:1137947-Pelagomonas_calceolata.AAC.2
MGAAERAVCASKLSRPSAKGTVQTNRACRSFISSKDVGFAEKEDHHSKALISCEGILVTYGSL